MQIDVDAGQCLFQNLLGAAHVITTGSHEEAIMILIIGKANPTDKAKHNLRRPPGMDGENESDAFICR